MRNGALTTSPHEPKLGWGSFVRSCRRLFKGKPKREFRDAMRSQLTRQRDGCGVQGLTIKCFLMEGNREQKGMLTDPTLRENIDIQETLKRRGSNTSGIGFFLSFFRHSLDRGAGLSTMAPHNVLPFLPEHFVARWRNISYCRQSVGVLELLLVKT